MLEKPHEHTIQLDRFRFHFRSSDSSEASAEPIKMVRRKSHLSFIHNAAISTDIEAGTKPLNLSAANKILDQTQEVQQTESKQSVKSPTKHYFHLLRPRDAGTPSAKPRPTSRFFSSPNTSFLHRKTKSFINDTTIDKILDHATPEAGKKFGTGQSLNNSCAFIKRRLQSSHRGAIQILGREISSAQKPPASDLSKRNRSPSSTFVKKLLPARPVNTSYFKL